MDDTFKCRKIYKGAMSSMEEISISAENLKKKYGETRAVDDVSFEVKKGEIFVMVGPNGAGKTTTIEMLEGLRAMDSGKASIAGMNPKDKRIREIIGIQLQESAFQNVIKVQEILELFGSFYEKSLDPQEVIKRLGLEEKAMEYYENLSGGLKQRVAIAVAMINDPEIVFLDELTTGLDPQARRSTWELVRNLKENEKTVFMTTHYMEEAEALGDRVAIINHGKLIALDTPENLIKAVGGETKVTYEGPATETAIPTIEKMEEIDGRIIICTNEPEEVISSLMSELGGENIKNLNIERMNLEDVYILLTGGMME
jgi:ABC-2 type transport system ATP-binding protein